MRIQRAGSPARTARPRRGRRPTLVPRQRAACRPRGQRLTDALLRPCVAIDVEQSGPGVEGGVEHLSRARRRSTPPSRHPSCHVPNPNSSTNVGPSTPRRCSHVGGPPQRFSGPSRTARPRGPGTVGRCAGVLELAHPSARSRSPMSHGGGARRWAAFIAPLSPGRRTRCQQRHQAAAVGRRAGRPAAWPQQAGGRQTPHPRRSRRGSTPSACTASSVRSTPTVRSGPPTAPIADWAPSPLCTNANVVFVWWFQPADQAWAPRSTLHPRSVRCCRSGVVVRPRGIRQVVKVAGRSPSWAWALLVGARSGYSRAPAGCPRRGPASPGTAPAARTAAGGAVTQRGEQQVEVGQPEGHGSPAPRAPPPRRPARAVDAERLLGPA